MPDGRTFLNMAFPLKDLEGKIVGSEIKNFGFKGCAEGSLKEIGAWYTDLTNKGVLGLSENPVDAISAHQLFLQDVKDIGYLSFGGAISEKQILLLNHLIKSYHLGQVMLLFDNDIMGLFYDCLICGALHFENRGEGFSFKTLMDKEKGVFNLVFECELEAGRYFKYKQLCVDNFQMLDAFKGFSLKGEKIYFEFLISEENLVQVTDMVIKLRSLDDFIVKKKPNEIYKDFNDELREVVWVKNK